MRVPFLFLAAFVENTKYAARIGGKTRRITILEQSRDLRPIERKGLTILSYWAHLFVLFSNFSCCFSCFPFFVYFAPYTLPLLYPTSNYYACCSKKTDVWLLNYCPKSPRWNSLPAHTQQIGILLRFSCRHSICAVCLFYFGFPVEWKYTRHSTPQYLV